MPIPSICWLIALIALLVLEAATVGLVSLWFAAGALCALLTSFFVDNIWVQFAVFLVVSFVCLIAIRPLARRYVNPRRVATNADRVIGAEGVVTQAIDNLRAQGQVSVSGGMSCRPRRKPGEGAAHRRGQADRRPPVRPRRGAGGAVRSQVKKEESPCPPLCPSS